MLSTILLLAGLAATCTALPQAASASTTDDGFYGAFPTDFPTDPAAIESLVSSAVVDVLGSLPTDPAAISSYASELEAAFTSAAPGFPTIAASDAIAFIEAIPTSIWTATDANIGCQLATGDVAWFTTLPAAVQTDVASFISAGEQWFATATVSGAQDFYSSLVAPFLCTGTASVTAGGANSTITKTTSIASVTGASNGTQGIITTTSAGKTSSTSGASTTTSKGAASSSTFLGAAGAQATGGVAASFGVIVGALGLMAVL